MVSADHVGDRRAVCRIAGEMDFDASAPLSAALEKVLGSGVEVLIVDLSGVEFFDSSGLNVLLGLGNAARTAAVELRLASLPAQVARVLDLTGAADVFQIDPSPDGKAPA